MSIGDKVKVSLPWTFGSKPIEKMGIIEEIYLNGMCKVKILLKHGGQRTVIGHIKDCVLVK